MMVFTVTHIGPGGAMHRRDVQAASNALAMAWMEQLYGFARAIVAIRKGGAA
ncbi:MAG: hypothetical protein M9929_03985 [Burkholderiaceae bacterium]|nr:hypothetical protein [Burkholderiaceae bacterium]